MPYPEILKQIEDQNENRREWKQSPEDIASMIRDEAHELVEALDNFPVNQDAESEVVSEIGDILYLAMRFCLEMGINPADAVKMKLMRNSVKYPDHFSSNGWDYETSRQKSKSLYESMGGDHAFFLWMMDQFD